MKYLTCLILLVGCSRTPVPHLRDDDDPQGRICHTPLIVYVDATMPKEEQAYVEAAVSFWNMELRPSRLVYGGPVVGPHEYDIGEVHVGYAKPRTEASVDVAATLYVVMAGCTITAMISLYWQLDTIDFAVRRFVLLHEMGHVIGLSDIEEDGYIMSGTLPRFYALPTALSDFERNELRRIYK